jgi:hypothetical protein
MKIDRNLNISFPIETEKGIIYVHSVPISREVFEQFYSELGQVFSQCFNSVNQAHLALSAPQLAYPALKSIAKKAGNWDEVEKGLVNEIIRLTNVAFAGENGWDTLPLDTAVKRDVLDEDSQAEVLSTLVFFCAISKVAPKEMKKSFLEMAGSLRSWQLTSSNFTQFITGLPTLTTKGSTGKKKTSSLIS